MIKILTSNIWLGIFIAIFTVVAVIYDSKKVLLISGVLILCAIQFYLTGFTNLTYLDNDAQRVQSERLISYTGINPARIEKNPLLIIYTKLEDNLFNFLNINFYFFGGFPKNTPSDYEKIPFILLPFFIAGVLELIKKKIYLYIFILTIPPLLVSTLVGFNNPFGLFSIFPFLIISIYFGVLSIGRKFNNPGFYILLIILIILVLAMQFNYSYV